MRRTAPKNVWHIGRERIEVVCCRRRL